MSSASSSAVPSQPKRGRTKPGRRSAGRQPHHLDVVVVADRLRVRRGRLARDRVPVAGRPGVATVRGPVGRGDHQVEVVHQIRRRRDQGRRIGPGQNDLQLLGSTVEVDLARPGLTRRDAAVPRHVPEGEPSRVAAEVERVVELQPPPALLRSRGVVLQQRQVAVPVAGAGQRRLAAAGPAVGVFGAGAEAVEAEPDGQVAGVRDAGTIVGPTASGHVAGAGEQSRLEQRGRRGERVGRAGRAGGIEALAEVLARQGGVARDERRGEGGPVDFEGAAGPAELPSIRCARHERAPRHHDVGLEAPVAGRSA